MQSNKLVSRFICLAASLVLLLPVAHAQKRVGNFPSADDAFLALRDASRRNDADAATEIAASLGDYAIPSYVDYYQIKPRVKDASATEILAFMERYKGSAIADRLRNDWLLELGKRGDWVTFDVQYPQFQLNDDTQLKCYALISSALKGVNVAAEARALLHAPKNYGDACVSLVDTLVQAGQFNNDELWTQIRLAAESGSTDYVRRFAPIARVDEKLLITAMDKPALIVTHSPGFRRVRHEIFVIALGRVARGDPAQAAAVLTDTVLLSRKQKELAWSEIALQASRKLLPQALDYWRKADDAPLSSEEYQWRVRTALLAGDWKMVRMSIEAMPASLRDDDAWTYWLARALRETGKPEQATALFQSLVSQTGFYGQLALEDVGQKITIPPRALPVTAAELAPMKINSGFRRALKFFDLGLRFEGYREWNWELRGMDDRQLLAAAEFARQNDVLDRMVNTSDRTKTEFDFSQRFPSPHRELMQTVTQRTGLEMAWVYGLIRQESRFVKDARSYVGASGLMQLMPGTAKYVAKKIGMSDFSHGKVNEVETNLILGTAYLNMILMDLDGSQPLATAGYNAGPRRAVAWRAALARPVEGAIFAEAIPFSETRDYVKKVMSNASYYAALFENQPQSLKQRLGTVTPGTSETIDLP